MGTYAVVNDVKARLPGRVIDATSRITTTHVDAWIDEHEAELEGLLRAAGLAVPVTNAAGIKIMRSKVVAGVAGRYERSSLSGTAAENDAGSDVGREYREFVQMIQQAPAAVAAMLYANAASSTSSLRSYPTDNDDGKSIADGDFDPVIARNTAW